MLIVNYYNYRNCVKPENNLRQSHPLDSNWRNNRSIALHTQLPERSTLAILHCMGNGIPHVPSRYLLRETTTHQGESRKHHPRLADGHSRTLRCHLPHHPTDD